MQSRSPYGMSEGPLVALLVQGIKAQQAQIDALKAQVAALQARR